MEDICQREIRECDEVIVTANDIVLIAARPPVTADEIAYYGNFDPVLPPPRRAVAWFLLMIVCAIYGFVRLVMP